MILLIKGDLPTLNKFIDEMAVGHDAIILHARDAASEIVPYIDQIDETSVVITFNNIGSGFALWKKLGVKLYNILVDHPANYMSSIVNDYYPEYHAVCIDRDHVRFLQEIFPACAASFFFMPHGGASVTSDEVSVDKDIDILYAGSIHSLDSIAFPPIQGIDAEAFYDTVISFYEKHQNKQAYDAVNDYAERAGIELTPSQRAMLTYYVVCSVEHYFNTIRRITLVEGLFQAGKSVHVCGGKAWEELAERYPEQMVYHGMLSPEDTLKLIGRSKILLNDLPYFTQGAHERIYNGMMRATVVVSNESEFLQERFTDGIDILYWDGMNTDILAGKIDKLLQDEQLREKIAQNAYEKVTDDTWSKRLDQIITR